MKIDWSSIAQSLAIGLFLWGITQCTREMIIQDGLTQRASIEKGDK